MCSSLFCSSTSSTMGVRAEIPLRCSILGISKQQSHHTSKYIYQDVTRGQFFISRTFPAGFDHHGYLRDISDGNYKLCMVPPREHFPRELATTGIYGMFGPGTGLHGNISRGNWPPREILPAGTIATTGRHGDFFYLFRCGGGYNIIIM